MELNNKNIGATVEEIRAFFEEARMARKDIIKVCLIMEEILLRCQSHFGTTHEFKVYKKKWFTTPKITIKIKGEPFNPLENDDDSDETILSNEIVQGLLLYEEAKTTYRYENGSNEIIFLSTRERKPLKILGGSITIAILLAIVFSFIMGFLPQEIQKITLEGIVSPLLSSLMNLIVTLTVFMIFISIVSSICAIEDITMLTNVGSTILKRFFALDLCIIALTMAVSLIFFPVLSIDDENSIKLEKIVDLLLSIIPTNILAAFLEGHVLQVAIMAFVVGICIATIRNRISNIKTFFTELNILVFNVVQLAFSVIPIAIFLCVFKTLMMSALSDFLKVWQLIVAELIIYAIIISILLIRLSFKTGISTTDFLKKIYPATLVSFATGSSVASLPKTLEVSKNELRIEEKLCNFWIPLSIVLFSPSKLIQLTIAGFYVITSSDGSMSLMDPFVITFLAMQLSMATPNAAGGIAASFSIMLTELGLPVEFVGSLMIADVLTGNLFTGFNVLVRQCELMTLSHKMGFIKGN